MDLMGLFRKQKSRGETAHEAIERLMTSELVDLLANQAVAEARAQIKANLELGQRANVREASERILKILNAYQTRAGQNAGRVELLKGSILAEAECFEEAKLAYQNVVDKKVAIDSEDIVLHARASLDLVRKRLQARLSTTDPNRPHLTAFYVCLKCGHFRLFLSAPCETCLYRPTSDDDLAASLLCVSNQMDLGSMLGISVRLRRGEKLGVIVRDLVSAIKSAKAQRWFVESAQVVRASTDMRTTRLADFRSCSRCKERVLFSMQNECGCGATLKLPPKQRLLICFDSLINALEDHWSLPKDWASVEWLSALVWARYMLLSNRVVPDLDLQSYLRDLLPKIGVLHDREGRGEVRYDEKGDPTIFQNAKSQQELEMLTLQFSIFNVEYHSMQKLFLECAL